MMHRTGLVVGRKAFLSRAAAAAFLCTAVTGAVHADVLLDIGILQLRNLDPTLLGTGITVAQAEATSYYDPNYPTGGGPYDPQYDSDNYEPDPAAVFTGSSAPAVTYIGKSGTTPSTTYNSAQYTLHGTTVAQNFYGTAGAAPGVNAVESYNANYFFNNIIDTGGAMILPLAPAGAAPVQVVNQSFTFPGASASDSNFISQVYDNYAWNRGTIFVTAVGNGGAPEDPAIAFNTIAVGNYPGPSSIGPTSGVSPASDGRSKPDITVRSSEDATSYSAPYVSGIVTVLLQAGAAGRGGVGTSTVAQDGRTITALLLNGAVKPAGWTHTTTQPLDVDWGAGIANAYNSYQILAAGKKTPAVVSNNQTFVQGTGIGTAGWNFATLTTGAGSVAHYSLDLSAESGPTTLTSTLVWWRPAGTVTTDANGFITSVSLTAINNLDLLLYNSAGMLVDSSVSTVDNLQQLYTVGLTPGHYDLQVVKVAGGPTSTETYAMAFNLSGGAVTLDGSGTVDLHGVSQTIGGITGNGTIINSLAGTTAVLTVVGASEFDGTLQNSAGAIGLAKTTSGIFTLTGSSFYTGGTEISGGTLLVSNTSGSATGSGNVTLDGGTLGGHGTISGAVVAGAGVHTIAPSATLAAGSTGKLTLGSLTTNNNTRLTFNLVSPYNTITHAASVNDVLAISSANGLTLNGGDLVIGSTSTGAGSLGYYQVIQYSGSIVGTGLSSIILPVVSNNIAYLFDTTRDPGYIDIHRGFLGDANDDGIVNAIDLGILATNYNSTTANWSDGDYNGDGIVNAIDLGILATNYNATVGAGSFDDALGAYPTLDAAYSGISPVPEPTTLAMIALGSGLLLGNRRRAAKVRARRL